MLELRNVSKRYVTKGGVTVNALDNLSMYFEEKGMVFVLGKSGSGKSTLLNVIGGLDKCDSGEIVIKDRSSRTFKGSDFDSYRNTFIGFIFQEYNILEEFTVKKNIGLALELQGKSADERTVDGILQAVDMQGLGDRKPNTLSGGQKQRVAIARALVKNPEIIMADEPTGALDSNTGKQVFDTLKNLSKEKLVIVVSHDRDFAEKYADRIIELADGKIISDVKKSVNEGKKIEDDVSEISDSILSIKKGRKLEFKDLDLINKFIEKQNEDIFITANKKINSDIKSTANLEGGDNFSFKEIKQNQIQKKTYQRDDFKLIRSKLPFKHSFKIGASGLKVKPIRLIFTIFLASIAFAFFGLADTISQFSRINTATDVLINENVQNAVMTKYNVYDYDGEPHYHPQDITQSEINALNTKYPEMKLKAVTNSRIEFSSYSGKSSGNQEYYYNTNSNGYIAFTKLEFIERGFKLLHGSFPEAKDEIAITKYQAGYFVKNNYSDNGNTITIDSEQDMLGKEFNNFKITGIIDTGDIDSKYDALKTTTEYDYFLMNGLNNLINYSYHNLIFTNTNFTNIPTVEGLEAYTFISNIGITKENDEYSSSLSYVKKYTASDLSSVLFFDGKTQVAEGETILSINYLRNNLYSMLFDKESSINYKSTEYEGLSFTDFIRDIDRAEHAVFVKFISENIDIIKENMQNLVKYSNYYGKITGDLNIVGFSTLENANMHGFMYALLNESEYAILKNSGETSYSFAIGKMPGTRSALADFLKETYKTTKEGENTIRFGLANSQVTMLDSFYTMIKMMAKVFMYIGIGFAVFSALLMLNFISTSIAYKKREIGILRAIGARSNDVFGIFFNESFIIACINTVVAIIFTVVACFFLNDSMKDELNYNANFLFFGIRQIILIFAISIVAAFVASFLPVKKIAAKKPIDAIRGR